MNPQETLTQLQAALTALDTEIAALQVKESECIDKARQFNDLRRVHSRDRIALEAKKAPLAEQAQALIAEFKKQQAEAVKAEAAAKEKARQETAKASEQSELETLRARLAELEGK